MADIKLTLDLVLSVEETTSHRVRKFGYGDGYEQVSPDGINTGVREYNITTRPLDSATFITFKGSLDRVCTGEFFVSTLYPYSSVSKRYRIVDSTYSSSHLPSSGSYIVSFTLIESFPEP